LYQTVYAQEVGRAGRDGLKAEAVLCYNATDLAQRHVEESVKNFCKDKDSCRREFISQYFDSQVSTPDCDCCDICDDTCSHPLKARDEVKIPSLTERQQMFDILNAYRLSDTSGDCQSLIDEHVMHLITDTFEYVEAVEEICKYYRQPTNIAESIHAIKRHVLSK
jgi:superfamily II DNA helicase RecQ